MKIELPLDGTLSARVRKVSNALFKSQYILELLVIIAQEPRFYHGLIVAKVPGIGGSFVTSTLKRYEECGLIRSMERDEYHSRQYYEKRQTNDPFWALVPEWGRFLIANPDPGVARAPLIDTSVLSHVGALATTVDRPAPLPPVPEIARGGVSAAVRSRRQQPQDHRQPPESAE